MCPHTTPSTIHGGQFQVIGREVLPELRASWEAVKDSYVDEGWKDTVWTDRSGRASAPLRWPVARFAIASGSRK